MLRQTIGILLALMFATAIFAQGNRMTVQDKYGHQLILEMNGKTGSAHRVYGILPRINRYGFEARNLNELSIESLTSKFLSDYGGILKVNPDQVKLRNAETDGKMWYVTYRQAVNGVPVYGTEIGYTINQDGDIIALGADVYQGIAISTTPALTADQGETAARKAFGVDSAEIKSPGELIIYPGDRDSATSFRLTWKIQLSSFKPLRNVIFFVDAGNGQVVAEQSNIRHEVTGNVSASYWPVRASDSPVQSGFWTTQIRLHDANYTYNSYTNSDNSGNYTLTAPYPGTWYIDFPLQDSWVKVYNYNGGNPQTVLRTVTTSWDGARSLNWGGSDSTNIRWQTTVAHDLFKSRFSYGSMDYQMPGYANALDDEVPPQPANGWADGYAIAFGLQLGYHWARSSDVVFHEYTHNVIYHLYGSFIGSSYASQGRAMDEGLADYFACSFNNHAVQGEDVGVNRNLNNSNGYPDNYNYDNNDQAAPYDNGLIVSGACWSLRQSIGSTITDFLVFKALQMAPHAYNFADFETNVIIADDQWYQSNHLSQIQGTFYAHGITSNALTVSVSGPTGLYIGNQGTWTVSASGGNGSYTYRWYLKSGDPQAGGHWIGPLSSGTSYSTQMHSYDNYLYVRADVVSGNLYFGSSYRYVTCTDCSGGPLTPQVPQDSVASSGASTNTGGDVNIQQNYPNPFNPTTQIRFTLLKPNHVTLVVYDMLGREVAKLADEQMAAGYHAVTWNASEKASGVYIYRLSAGNTVQVRRMLMLK